MKKLTVITINYNNHTGLKKTMTSVLSQTNREAFDYVIIDGGSTDGSAELIIRHADALSYYCSERDGGIYNAMNKGVAHSEGEYLLFLNSGDVFDNSHVIESILPNLDGTDIIYGDLLLVGANTETDTSLLRFPDRITLQFLLEASLPHPASFIRRELLIRHPYDETLRVVSDWKFFVEVLYGDRCSYRHIAFTVSRFDTSGVSRNNQAYHLKERKETEEQLFSPIIRELYDQWSEFNANPLLPEMQRLGHTRKLWKRLRPLIRTALWINGLFSRR